MIPLLVVMLYVLLERPSQRLLPEQDHLRASNALCSRWLSASLIFVRTFADLLKIVQESNPLVPDTLMAVQREKSHLFNIGTVRRADFEESGAFGGGVRN